MARLCKRGPFRGRLRANHLQARGDHRSIPADGRTTEGVSDRLLSTRAPVLKATCGICAGPGRLLLARPGLVGGFRLRHLTPLPSCKARRDNCASGSRAPRARIEAHGDPRGKRGESAGAPRSAARRSGWAQAYRRSGSSSARRARVSPAAKAVGAGVRKHD